MLVFVNNMQTFLYALKRLSSIDFKKGHIFTLFCILKQINFRPMLSALEKSC